MEGSCSRGALERDDDMSLRTRLLLAFAAVVLPIAVLVFGLRDEMTTHLSKEYRRRVDGMVHAIDTDLRRESDDIQQRLHSVRDALVKDNRLRAAIAGVETERTYLLEYGGVSMALTGLSMLQILDGEGRIISSGHFRNEHGRDASDLARALTDAQGRDGLVLVTAQSADREFLALARSEPLQIGDRGFTLIGGIVIDEAFLRGVSHDPEIHVVLQFPGGGLSTDSAASSGEGPARDSRVVSQLSLPLIRQGVSGSTEVVQAQLLVQQPLTGLATLLGRADSWFVTTAIAAGITALLLAVWVSSRISRSLAELAEKTAVLDLDRLDFHYDAGTGEVGTLARVLGDLSDRLRSSTARIREAERKATVGDLARQINHDIKNGLIPLRNVMRHLAQVGRERPEAVGSVLAERHQTIDSSIAYLETLATNYERLSIPHTNRNCDLHSLIEEVVRGAQGHDHVELQMRLDASSSRIIGDPVAVRRVLENLLANAVDSLQDKPGRVTVSTETVTLDAAPPSIRVIVADTGCGMSTEELGKIFNAFYTTKEKGTGLGLSIVRRLVMDLHGTLRVESEPGTGTRMTIELPLGSHPATPGHRNAPLPPRNAGSIASGARVEAPHREPS